VVVGTLRLSLKLEGSHSLKEKRRIIRSLMEKSRRDFHVAAAEVDDQELWGNATIGFACVSNDASHVESIIQHVLDSADQFPEVEVEYVERDVIRM
jgi:uncharacterized protein